MSEDLVKLNPEERKKYAGAIEEIVRELTIIEAAKEQIKEIATQQKEKYDIKPAVTNKAAKIAYHHNLEEERKSSEELFDWIDVTLGDLVK